jgi:hypothetical protein
MILIITKVISTENISTLQNFIQQELFVNSKFSTLKNFEDQHIIIFIFKCIQKAYLQRCERPYSNQP